MKNVIWQPQKKQASFLERPEYEALYGGAAGGGKSEAAIMLPLSQINIPHFRALILRKTYPQLTELIDKSLRYYPYAVPDAKYNSTLHRWTFPSGAVVAFGSMNHPLDRENYRGRQYDMIIFDELTQFSWDEYSFMFSRNRPSGPGTFVCIRATTNPGGIGHTWVRDRFITPAPPMTTIREKMDVTDPDGKVTCQMRERIFVPATVWDNGILLGNDPGYLANLAMLPESEKQAQLYGSWDSFSGQVFSEWKNDPDHARDRAGTHVIAPFDIPKWWNIVRGFDFGYSRPFSVGWFACDGDGRLYLIREFYGTTGNPNEGAKMEPAAIAAEIKRIEEDDPNIRGHTVTGVADPSIFDESRGESVARMMERAPNFILFSPGDNHRLAGKMQLHHRLAFDENGIPMLYVFNTCKHFIRTVPALCYDPCNVEDIDTRQEDHCYDMCRYVLMQRPISASPPKDAAFPKLRPPDPLDMRKK